MGEDDREPTARDAGGSFRISEDWAATVVGLILIGLAIAGVITKAMVP
jgi:hypothetical protein